MKVIVVDYTPSWAENISRKPKNKTDPGGKSSGDLSHRKHRRTRFEGEADYRYYAGSVRPLPGGSKKHRI